MKGIDQRLHPRGGDEVLRRASPRELGAESVPPGPRKIPQVPVVYLHPDIGSAWRGRGRRTVGELAPRRRVAEEPPKGALLQ
jgi:hypothetical protein